MSINANSTPEDLRFHAMTTLASGKPPEAVVQSMIEQGISKEVAESTVAKAAIVVLPLMEELAQNSWRAKLAIRVSGLQWIGIGLAMAAVGGVITGVSYEATKPGGEFLLMSGLIVGGAAIALVGVIRLITGWDVE